MQRLRGGPAAERRDIVGVFRDALTDRPSASARSAPCMPSTTSSTFSHNRTWARSRTRCSLRPRSFFTVAVLRMRNMLGEFRVGQKVGLGFLFLGAVLVALRDVATGVAATSGNRASASRACSSRPRLPPQTSARASCANRLMLGPERPAHRDDHPLARRVDRRPYRAPRRVRHSCPRRPRCYVSFARLGCGLLSRSRPRVQCSSPSRLAPVATCSMQFPSLGRSSSPRC